MNGRNEERRPGRRDGAQDHADGQVEADATAPAVSTIDRQLDRAAHDVACGICFLEREQVGRVSDRVGGSAEIVRILAAVKQAWADLAVAAFRVLDECPQALVAADEVELLAGLAGVDERDLTSWVLWRDPFPAVGYIVSVLRRLDRVCSVRELAPDAHAVADALDHGELPDRVTWYRLRGGVDDLLALGVAV